MVKGQELFFEKDSKNQHREAKFLLEEVEKLDKTRVKTVLDIGCADGSLTRKLRAFFPEARIYAIDISAPIIKYAREQEYPEDISFLVQDISDKHLIPELSSLLGKVDLVFSNMVLNWAHVDRRFQVAANIHELLGAGGLAVGNIVLHKDPKLSAIEEEKKILERYFGPVNKGEELKDWLLYFEECGFVNTRHRVRSWHYHPLMGFEDCKRVLTPVMGAFRAYLKPGLSVDDEARALETALIPTLRGFATKLDEPPFWGDLNEVREFYADYFTLFTEKKLC